MRKLGFFFVVANVVWMAACGGGGGGSSNSTITSVSVSCSPASVSSGGTSQCTASVSGTGNFSQNVTWTTTAGTITSSGLLTAPAVTTSLLITVTATSTQDTTKSGTASVTDNPGTTSSNVAPLIVDSGPDGAEANIAYTTVTVCVPGTSQCQTIDHIQVDTGSSGLRLLSNVLTIPLPQSNDSSGNPLDECLVFLDGYVWGPVVSADITIAGEKASSVPVHMLIPSTSSPAVPSSCSNQTTGPDEGGSVSALGSNGILGVGFLQQDCGLACTNQNSQIPDWYYDCPASGCNATYVTLQQEVWNPVALFSSSDNNGVLIQLPSVPDGGSQNVSGSLIFGIGTQSNNGLNGANIYQVPDQYSSTNNVGDIITTYGGQSYNLSFIDSGSNALFFLDTSTTGIPVCQGFQGASDWYCPTSSPQSLTAANQGQDDSGPVGSPVPVNFSVESASTLFQSNNNAWSTLGGPYSPPPVEFDWGLPFFFGRNVFTAIDTATTPGGTGPYVAY
jgi:Protein of unknown function (DUF3443)